MQLPIFYVVRCPRGRNFTTRLMPLPVCLPEFLTRSASLRRRFSIYGIEACGKVHVDFSAPDNTGAHADIKEEWT